MKKTRHHASQAAAAPAGLQGDLPGWLRWFANLGLSLSAAGYAITVHPPAPMPPSAAARRRHV